MWFLSSFCNANVTYLFLFSKSRTRKNGGITKNFRNLFQVLIVEYRLPGRAVTSPLNSRSISSPSSCDMGICSVVYMVLMCTGSPLCFFKNWYTGSSSSVSSGKSSRWRAVRPASGAGSHCIALMMSSPDVTNDATLRFIRR